MINLSEWNVPRQMRLIFPRFQRMAEGLYDVEVYAVASGIMETFIANQHGKFPKLTEERSIALSAALECVACAKCGVDARNDVIDRYGITERRLKNALAMIYSVLLSPQEGEQDY